MVLVEGTLQNLVDSAPAEADGELKSNKSDSEPYMRHRLRDRLSFWRDGRQNLNLKPSLNLKPCKP